MPRRVGVALLVAIVAVACGSDDNGANDAERTPSPEPTREEVPGDGAAIELSSPAFEDGGNIPRVLTCDGSNASPSLRWSGVADDAVELALLMEDPDAPAGVFVHWVVWAIDPALGELPEETVPADVMEGANGAGQTGYLGPCPPGGDEPHRYVFTVYALSEPLQLPEGASAEELRAAVEGKTRGVGMLTGLYARS
jgi:Raf kinase inhibitor-like YbhB/YbcL family protein